MSERNIRYKCKMRLRKKVKSSFTKIYRLIKDDAYMTIENLVNKIFMTKF